MLVESSFAAVVVEAAEEEEMKKRWSMLGGGRRWPVSFTCKSLCMYRFGNKINFLKNSL